MSKYFYSSCIVTSVYRLPVPLKMHRHTQNIHRHPANVMQDLEEMGFLLEWQLEAMVDTTGISNLVGTHM